MDVDDEASRILSEVFGYSQFRGEQREIIAHLARGDDALVLMPTGGGKSLCFQIPALLRDGMGVVVSPLIALMQDQVAALQEAGVRAAALNSAMSWPQVAATERQARAGQLDLLYVAPERLLTERCLSLLDECRLALFAIDEAHCVSQWGHDFRPEYLQLAVLAERYPGVPRIALTATADIDTRKEMIDAAAPARAASVHRQLRSAQHPVPDRREGQPPPTAPAFHPRASMPATPASSIAWRAPRWRRPRTSWSARGSRRCPTTPASIAARARTTSAASFATTASSWWRPSPSEWASTSPTCASLRIWICRRASKAITRRRVAPAATAFPRTPGWSTACRMSCSSGG